MSWMAAHDYLALEQAVRDRVDDLERFGTERAFRSETPDLNGTSAGRTPASPRAGCPSRLLASSHCSAVRLTPAA